MNEEMIKAVKQFGREDLINSPYGHDIDENIEVFMTIREMIKYNNLQNNWNELKKFVEEKMSVYEHKEASNFYVVFEKMQVLEQGKDE